MRFSAVAKSRLRTLGSTDVSASASSLISSGSLARSSCAPLKNGLVDRLASAMPYEPQLTMNRPYLPSRQALRADANCWSTMLALTPALAKLATMASTCEVGLLDDSRSIEKPLGYPASARSCLALAGS